MTQNADGTQPSLNSVLGNLKNNLNGSKKSQATPLEKLAKTEDDSELTDLEKEVKKMKNDVDAIEQES